MADPTKRGPFTVTSSEIVYRNPWIQVREDRVVNDSGREGLWGIIEMTPGSTVLALDNDLNAYLVREYKYAVDRQTVELVSGGLDDGETPLDGAKRELKEELGLEAAEWIDLGVVDPFTTAIRSPNHMFVAIGISHGEASTDEWERIELVKMPYPRVLAAAMSSEITHAASALCVIKSYHALMQHPTYAKRLGDLAIAESFRFSSTSY